MVKWIKYNSDDVIENILFVLMNFIDIVRISPIRQMVT